MKKHRFAWLPLGAEVLCFGGMAFTGLPKELVLEPSPQAVDAAVLAVERRTGPFWILFAAIAVLGAGCRKGTPAAALERAFAELLEKSGLNPLAFYKVCSIDLKRDEPGLLAFCQSRGLAFETFSAQALLAVEGDFSPSGFVRSVTGVDNVCERAAVLGSGGALIVKKQAGDGVTMAAALAPFSPDWRWRDE